MPSEKIKTETEEAVGAQSEKETSCVEGLKFAPKEYATRAETATMHLRLLKVADQL